MKWQANVSFGHLQIQSNSGKLESKMKLFGSEGVLLMEVESITASDRNLQIKGKMMGQVPMKVVVRPSDLREAFGLLSLPVIWQTLKMLLTRGND